MPHVTEGRPTGVRAPGTGSARRLLSLAGLVTVALGAPFAPQATLAGACGVLRHRLA